MAPASGSGVGVRVLEQAFEWLGECLRVDLPVAVGEACRQATEPGVGTLDEVTTNEALDTDESGQLARRRTVDVGHHRIGIDDEMRQAAVGDHIAHVGERAWQPIDGCIEVVEAGIRQPAKSEPVQEGVTDVTIDDDDARAGHQALREDQVARIPARDPVDDRLVEIDLHAAQRLEVLLPQRTHILLAQLAARVIEGARVEAIVAYPLGTIEQRAQLRLVAEQGGDAFDPAAGRADQQNRCMRPLLALRLGDDARVLACIRQRFQARQHAGQAML